MTKAIRIYETGGPEVMQYEHIDVGTPGSHEVLIAHTAIGINFIDTYHRSGLYPVEGRPFTPGSEGAGVVVEVGAGVSSVKPGQRVAYTGAIGSYSEQRLIHEDHLIVLNDGISDKLAASIMLKGLTAHYLLRLSYKVSEGDLVLFHAAAGGVGQIACQWAKHLGATIIGTVGSDSKAEVARKNGCDHVINYAKESFVERVQELTDGRGVDVVYDGVGQDTFPMSLDCLRPRGMWVSYGNASGPVPDFSLLTLAQKGSLFATRPTLAHYIATREALLANFAELSEVIESGAIDVSVDQEYALDQAVKAHQDLEGRKTTGASILLP